MTGRRDPLVLLIVAGVLLAPSLVLGNLLSHSSPQNVTWAAQFVDQFQSGVLYPRWLPDSFDGLGSPTFYFYPPIAFWVTALISLVTLGALSTSYCLSLATLVLLWASGMTMRAWLRPATGSARLAFYGALAYMAAPYHLVDHYYRGAFAEFAAYAVLPLVMLSVRRIADGRRYGVLALAASYAALPMAHLPTSLLISLTALPLYVLYRGWRLAAPVPALKFFGQCASGGVLGLGLAAIYLAPALGLQHWIPADTFWEGDYQAQNWFLLTPGRWPPPLDMMLIIVFCAVAYTIAAIGVIVLQVRSEGWAGWRSEPMFWSLLCLLCVLLIAGVLPWFWLIPFTAKVQFPWRLMIVVEFAAVTALCLAPWASLQRAAARVLRLALLALAPAIVILVAAVGHRVDVSLAMPEEPADLKQFLPAGFPMKPASGYAELGLEPLRGVPTIACTPAPRTCRAAALPLGELAIEIDGDGPTDVVVRRFAYPFWRTEPSLPITATEPLRLVAFTVPAGRHAVRLQHKRPMAELVGWVISGLSLVLFAAGALVIRYTSARNPGSAPAR
jgi:uncharacterized membrane protein